MSALIDHMESRLGPMRGAWSAGSEAAQVGYFREGSLGDGVESFATIGLHRAPLVSRTTGRELHLELLACVYSGRENGYGPFPDVLTYVAGQLLSSRKAILRGDVVKLPAPLVPGGPMNALYASLPVYFDDEFGQVRLESGVGVALVWLFPVGDSEVRFIEDNGWEMFESELVRQDPDLLDLQRGEMKLSRN